MLFLNKLNFFKLSQVWQPFLRIKAGGVMLIVRYNAFLERNEPFGIKFGTLNLKRVRENRGSMPFLRMLRRSNRDTYKKFTHNTEVQFNIVHNEFVLENSFNFLKLGLVKPITRIINLFDGFTGTVFSKAANYHTHAARVEKIKNINKISFSVRGFKGVQNNLIFLYTNRGYSRVDFFGFLPTKRK